MAGSSAGSAEESSITDVPGVRVGNWTDAEARTGCTVVLLPDDGAVAGVDVRGSAPGTRETDLLEPGRLVERVHALVLSGGSAFGLAAADGVMGFLRERGVGLDVGPARVPLVPAAVLFDLAVGSATAHPGPAEGRIAAEEAASGGGATQGPIGAGTGASVGKMLGPEFSVRGGLGSASLRLPGGATVGALAAVNALGDVVDDRGEVIAGARRPDGTPIDQVRTLLEGGLAQPPVAGANTTLVVVATDARLRDTQARKLAQLAHDGLAQAIRPVHTLFDGDTCFAVGTGDLDADPTLLGIAVVEVVRAAVQRAVR